MEEKRKLVILLEQLTEGKISRREFDELIARIRDVNDDSLNEAADQVLKSVRPVASLKTAEQESLYQTITADPRFEASSELRSESYGYQHLYRSISIAALLIITLATGLYFYSRPAAPDAPAVSKRPSKTVDEISPGGDRAILTLADGKKIILDDLDNGVVARQEGVSIHKTSDGQLAYTFTGAETASQHPAAYNTVETPAGGKYQVNLPDGSKVWLNSSSSLRFPALFTGNTREVQLSGEAFFDVARDEHRPFKVIARDQVVEVLGTQFNISSYADGEAPKTTLIEGSVKVHYKDKVVLLSPGEQFKVGQGGNSGVSTADTEEATAWKNGYFLFKNEDIKSVMLKIARWYDVEVVYEGNLPGVGFGGNISRSKDIDEVLGVLQLTNVVKFKIEGRRVTVMP